jgi:hypothetical protein
MESRHHAKLFAIGMVGILISAGCKAGSPTPAADKPADKPVAVAAAPAPASGNTSKHGNAITPGAEAALAKVLSNPRDYEGKTVTVEGEVRRVCKKMGCWMELATAPDDSAPGCRVFFGAHQFFVPKDSDGAKARVQGQVQIRKVQASFVQHLEEEGASFKAKNADGTADEVRLVATGVELTKT